MNGFTNHIDINYLIISLLDLDHFKIICLTNHFYMIFVKTTFFKK